MKFGRIRFIHFIGQHCLVSMYRLGYLRKAIFFAIWSLLSINLKLMTDNRSDSDTALPLHS